MALPTTMLMIFLIYWRLPNRKIPMKRLIPASAVVAVLLEISKYLNILTWPWLRAKLEREVPPFVQSISIVLWSFMATLILLTGAEWSARAKIETLEGPEDEVRLHPDESGDRLAVHPAGNGACQRLGGCARYRFAACNAKTTTDTQTISAISK